MTTYQIGPDAYSGNGAVDWAAAQSAGRMSFAILKACENTTPDGRYAQYRAQCEYLGVPTSAYLFMHFGAAAATPQAQAEALFAACCPINKTGFVPTIDVEFPGGRASHGITAQQALDAVRACAQRIFELFGAWPMIYTSAVIWADPDGLDGLPATDLAEHCALWDKWWPFAQGTPAVYGEAEVDAIGQPTVPTPWADEWTVHQYDGDNPGYPGFSTPCDLNRVPVLEVGSSGPQVKWLQARVGVTPDGDFGAETKAAVETFQTAHGLTADGIAGVATQAAASWVVLA